MVINSSRTFAGNLQYTCVSNVKVEDKTKYLSNNVKVYRGDELYELGKMIVYFLELLAWYKIRVSEFRGERVTMDLTSQY